MDRPDSAFMVIEGMHLRAPGSPSVRLIKLGYLNRHARDLHITSCMRILKHLSSLLRWSRTVVKRLRHRVSPIR